MAAPTPLSAIASLRARLQSNRGSGLEQDARDIDELIRSTLRGQQRWEPEVSRGISIACCCQPRSKQCGVSSAPEPEVTWWTQVSSCRQAVLSSQQGPYKAALAESTFVQAVQVLVYEWAEVLVVSLGTP